MKRKGKVTGRWSGRKYSDDCECDARDRRTCQQACKPTRDAAHRKHIKENRGGRDDRPAGTPGATPLVRLMQSHSPAALAGITSHNSGVDDFPDGGRPVPWQFQIAEYELRESRKGNGQWGIYCREYNVRLATFAPNSFALRDALSRGFDAAHVLKKKRADEFKVSRMPVDQQIKLRQAADRAANNGWYMHGCGQWVHDKLCPCSVCPRPRRPRKKK